MLPNRGRISGSALAGRGTDATTTMELWEQIALGAIILLVLLWQGPALLRSSREQDDGPKDWMGALIPLGLVVLFVLFLISMI